MSVPLAGTSADSTSCEPGSRGRLIAAAMPRDNWARDGLVPEHEGIATVRCSTRMPPVSGGRTLDLGQFHLHAKVDLGQHLIDSRVTRQVLESGGGGAELVYHFGRQAAG